MSIDSRDIHTHVIVKRVYTKLKMLFFCFVLFVCFFFILSYKHCLDPRDLIMRIAGAGICTQILEKVFNCIGIKSAWDTAVSGQFRYIVQLWPFINMNWLQSQHGLVITLQSLSNSIIKCGMKLLIYSQISNNFSAIFITWCSKSYWWVFCYD